ncbi:TPA: resolvase, partial [Clostridium perfringens]
KSNIVELELQELNSKIKTDKALIYNNIKAFNNNLSVDDKRKITMSIFKKIVYDPETNDLDVTFM